MKKLYFFMLAVIAAVTANAATVYFENTGNWSTVNAYYWGGSGAPGWPGNRVTETVTVTVQGSSATKTLYKYDTGNNPNVIFNNGSGSQTTDLKATDNVVYSFEANGSGKSIDPIGTVSGSTFIPAGIVEINYAKIYIPYDSFKQNAAYIYTWSPSLFGGWPGKQMSKVNVNGNEFWMIEIDDRLLDGNAIGGWLIHTNSGTQTKDIKGVAFKNDYVYNISDVNNPESTPLDEYIHVENPDVITYELRGQIFGDSNWADYPMTETDGIWTVSGAAVPGSFGIKQLTNGIQTNWISSPTGSNVINAAGVYTTATENNTNFSSTLVGDVTFAFNPEANTLTVTGGEPYEEKWYASYNITGEWEFNIEMQPYTYDGAENTVFIFVQPTQASNYFTFTTGKMENWAVQGGIRYGSGDSDLVLEEGQEYRLVADSSKCFIIPGSDASRSSSDYNVMVDTKNLTIKVDKDRPSGIANIENVDNAAAEYFTLQGVRIDRPAKGQLVIERRAGRAAKIIF